MDNENTQLLPPGEGATPLLEQGAKQSDDMRLIAKAVRNRWDVPEPMRQLLKQRLTEILAKREVSVMTQEGPAMMEAPADANALRAAAVLVQMEAQNQADDHLADKNARLDAGKPTELNGVIFRTPLTKGAYDDPGPTDR